MVNRLKKARRTFRSYAEWAHITILGVRDGTQPELTQQQGEKLVQASKAAIRETFQSIPPLRIRLDVLRPGYIPRMPGVSDSTVVWVADKQSEQKVLNLTARYRAALEQTAPDLPLDLNRKMGGVWLTVGLFEEEENFEIEGSVEQAFTELAGEELEVELDALVFCQARRKSLEDGRGLDHMLLTEPVNPHPAKASVENPKVGVPAPRFKPFPGVTDILLNPRREPYVANDIEEIRDDIEAEPQLRLFRSIFRPLDRESLGRQALTCGLALLEAPTAHVTKLGLIDQDNVGLVNKQDRTEFLSYLADIPGSVSKGWPAPLLKVLMEYQQDRPIPPIRLRFRKLTLWGAPSFPLVARLEPVDGQSYSAYYSINRDRMRIWGRLSELAEDQAAWPKLGDWTPHVSIAYVLCEDFVPTVKLRMADWVKAIRACAKEESLEFAASGIYAFPDMSRFIKVSSYRKPQGDHGS
ncbi:MAG TPA: hypothetical protein VIY49_08120 [Bryobacteraceae bacterium]